MPATHTPLRYPGGKSSIQNMVSRIISDNGLNLCNYAEPYAGGCGLALSLMFNGFVHELHLNDLDRSIYSFWNQVLTNTDAFVEKIKSTSVTIDEWHKQKEVQERKNTVDELELGFSTFFLNRTNRSGVIQKAGVIGGLAQNGNYKLDCRFTKSTLISKIQRIAKYKHRINFYNLDAVDFIKMLEEESKGTMFYCVDPPYFNKGSTLYTNFYNPEDHAEIAKLLRKLKSPWILTYDDASEIQKLYKNLPQYKFNLNYSAQVKKVGTELLITSKKIKIYDDLRVIAA